MLKLSTTTKFSKDLKLCQKRNYNLNLLYNIVNTLRIPAALPPKNKDHDLKGILMEKENATLHLVGY